jgi:protein O-GlcNAc transferase
MAPPVFDALSRARSLLEQGALGDSARECESLLRRQPRLAGAAHLLGIIRSREGRLEEAVQCLKRAAALDPRSFAAWRDLALAEARLGRGAAAAASIAKALTIRGDADAQNDAGAVLTVAARPADALLRFEKAIALRPDDPDAHSNRGNALRALARPEEAQAAFERAVTLAPQHGEAWNGLGATLAEAGRFEAAVAAFGKALALRPRHAEAHNNLGNALRNLNRPEEAVRSYEQALALAPSYAEAWSNLGNALKMLRRHDAALAAYEKALALSPLIGNALSHYALLKRQVCDWQALDALDRRIVDAVESGRAAILPFAFLAVSDDPAQQLACARHHARGIRAQPLSAPPRGDSGGRVRLGYLSGDFHDHATARLMAELFERHDRRRFAVFAFSHGPDDGSALRRRLEAAFDSCVDLRGAGDAEIAARIAAAPIDLLIDLKGHTEGNRLGVLARRSAPVQAHYLGYPGTLGTGFVDYLILDPFLAPPEAEAQFAEKLVLLPDCYQVNDRHRAIAAETPERRDCGLPDEGFVFCSFNNSYKITPAVFAIWMRLLENVPGSVLWLLADNRWAEANLRREAAARGIAPERLVFAPRRPLAEHLARHRLADLFLDTVPVNAHTGASDALWAGLPLLTCAGRSVASRVAGSLLRAAGLPELVATSPDEYEQGALALAQDPPRLEALRRRLGAARDSAPLFDTERTCRQLEAAYLTMSEIHRRGESPRPFAVPRES